MNSHKKSLFLPILAITAVPILYGSFYIITKLISQNIPLFWLIFLRMGFALIGFLPFIKKTGKMDKPTFKLSLLLSLVFFLGVVFQTIGLQFIEAGKAGFISGLFVILTPILSRILYKTKLDKLYILPILFCLIGLFIMFFNLETNFLSIGKGELLQFFGAITIAFHILFISKYIKDINIFNLTICQIIFILFTSLILALFTENSYSFSKITYQEWFLLAYLGIFTTTFTFILQVWGQKSMDETSSAIIISVEPIFAVLFGFIFGHEILTLQLLFGGFILLCGFITTVFLKKRIKNQDLIEILN